jgi:hypothetical protein
MEERIYLYYNAIAAHNAHMTDLEGGVLACVSHHFLWSLHGNDHPWTL